MKCPTRSHRGPLAVLLLIGVFALALTGAFFAGGGDADASIFPFHVKSVEIPGIPDNVPITPGHMKVDVRFNIPFANNTVTADSLYIEKKDGAKMSSYWTSALGDEKRLFLYSVDPLEPSTEYRVVFTPDIKSVKEGVLPAWPLEPKVVTFKTTGPPTITLRQPTINAKDVPLDINIVVSFDREMDYSTLNGNTFYLTELSSGAKVPAKLEAVTPYVFQLVPNDNLKPDTKYRVNLVSGANGIKAVNGWEWPKPLLAWNFITDSSQQLMPSFSDVKPGDDYYGAIMFLAFHGIASGYDNKDGTFSFRPKNPLWRAQFAKMVINTLGDAVSEDQFPHPQVPFTDLGPDDLNDLYPHEYVAVCFLKGITKGSDPDDPTKFSPYVDIPRYQVISMVVRAAKQAPKTPLFVLPGPNDGKWRDDPVHGANAAWAEVNGLLAGLDLDKLDPWGKMTRGETAQVLYNLYQLLLK